MSRGDRVSVFNVELKKVVDDSYEIEIGHDLIDQLAEDLGTGLLGKVKKLAVITDSNVCDLYAKPICQRLLEEGFKAELFVFPAGEKSKTTQNQGCYVSYHTAKVRYYMVKNKITNIFC